MIVNPTVESLVEDFQAVQIDTACPSPIQPLPLEERLKQLLEPDDKVQAAKEFLSNLASVKLDDPEVIAKIHQHTTRRVGLETKSASY